MNLTVSPGAPLIGEVRLPGDKSISHRAALLAAMVEGESRIRDFLVSGVTHAMLGALTSLGIDWELDQSFLTVRSPGMQAWRPPVEPIDCGNSGTTLRLLAGALAAASVPAILDGSPRLRARPMKRIIEPLQQMGVAIAGENDCAPLRLGKSSLPLRALDYSLPVASAQVKSCLLLAALAADRRTTLREPGPSRDHTERMLRSLGVHLTHEQVWAGSAIVPEYVTRLDPPRPLHLPPFSLVVPGDFSAAAFLIVAALITPGSQISLQGIGLNPTRTGLLDVLAEMGANIQTIHQSEQYGEPVGDLTVRASPLQGTCVSGSLVVRMIDEFPAFAVAAAFAEGQTAISQAEELRYKESDRIAAMSAELRSLGVEVEETPDGFTIQGYSTPQGGRVRSHGDHRLAMALAVAGLAARSAIRIQDSESISESFPAFQQSLTSLGGKLVSEP
jgi:3-phosphoshikimate 1-carboxyvinyltransferase